MAFNLLIDHDDIAGKTRSARAQSLIELCERTGRADLLIGHIRRLRPDAALPSQLRQIIKVGPGKFFPLDTVGKSAFKNSFDNCENEPYTNN